jgi:hypothetical protein
MAASKKDAKLPAQRLPGQLSQNRIEPDLDGAEVGVAGKADAIRSASRSGAQW